tara:strand:- start:1 stop:231 length:231 start_codon:yes stop_codon:yes gene_type:complete
MTADRIKEIQDKTAFPDSLSVCQALLQVWNECEQDNKGKKYTEEDIEEAFNSGRGYGVPDNIKDLKSFIDSLNKQD